MRPDSKQGVFSSLQFIAIMVTLAATGMLLNPDLLKFYSGKPDLLISEFLTENRTHLQDVDGDFSDWIELYNASEETVSLTGYYLTDDFKDYDKWKLPKADLRPGEFLMIWASGKNRTNWLDDLHTNFKLSRSGEYLALIRPNGKTVAHEYHPKYPHQKPDVSFGLTKEHFETHRWLSKEPLRNYYYFNTPSPLKANQDGSLTAE
jgi:hypothetical protein